MARSTRTTIIGAAAVALTATGCARHHLANADRDYERMAYASAAKHYRLADAAPDERRRALRLAYCYARMNDQASAAQWFEAADRKAPVQGDTALAFGRALMSCGKDAQAAALFNRLLAERPEDPVVRALGTAIVDRDAYFADSAAYTVAPVNIEGVSSAFSAIPFGNGILFAAERQGAAERNPWNNQAFLDLCTAQLGEGIMAGAPALLPGEVNGRYHDGPAALSPDGRTLFFTRSDYFKHRLNKDGQSISHLMLFKAERQEDGRWGRISSFAYNGDDFSAGHAALSADGHTLFYVSDMPGGHGGTDLYACEKTADGWGYPRNLGPAINTPGNEMFPTVRNDTLYFASNGHPCIGGLDIFWTRLSDGDWLPPVNPGYPLNSAYDDFSLVPTGAATGLLSSNRLGNDRVFRYMLNTPTFSLHGLFLDDETGAPLAGVEVRLLEPSLPEPLKLFTDEDGAVTFPLSADKLYELTASKDGRFTESISVSTMGQKRSRVYEESIRMRLIEVDKPIVIENIYYDYDRWDIRPDAAIELDKVARLFLANPSLSFELGSHTDSRASDSYNLVLSDARAKSAVDYLVRQGVPQERLTAKGYGERKLTNRCRDGVACTEDEHQANRRTEFKVIGIAPALSEQRPPVRPASARDR